MNAETKEFLSNIESEVVCVSVCVCIYSRKTCPAIFCRTNYSFLFLMRILYITYSLSVFPQMLATYPQFSRHTVATGDPPSDQAEFSILKVLRSFDNYLCVSYSP